MQHKTSYVVILFYRCRGILGCDRETCSCILL